MISTIAVFVFTLLIIKTIAVCPDGWLHHGTSCYLFSSDEFSWNMAQEICKEYQGGYLAEIETKEENVFLQTIARHNKKSYWLGGSDERSEGRWYWTNSNRPITYTDWGSAEPNNEGNEDCLHFTSSKNFHWNDLQCSTVQHYICEASFSSGEFL